MRCTKSWIVSTLMTGTSWPSAVTAPLVPCASIHAQLARSDATTNRMRRVWAFYGCGPMYSTVMTRSPRSSGPYRQKIRHAAGVRFST